MFLLFFREEKQETKQETKQRKQRKQLPKTTNRNGPNGLRFKTNNHLIRNNSHPLDDQKNNRQPRLVQNFRPKLPTRTERQHSGHVDSGIIYDNSEKAKFVNLFLQFDKIQNSITKNTKISRTFITLEKNSKENALGRFNSTRRRLRSSHFIH